MKKIFLPILCCTMLLGNSSCSLMEWAALSSPDASNETKGAVIGASSGARAGAFVGSMVGHGYHHGHNALLGAAIGTVAGAVIGGAIGNDMDKKQQAAASGEMYDYRDSGNNVRFKSGRSSLDGAAKRTLNGLAIQLRNDPSAVAEIYGHTDDQGSYMERRQISVARANEVRTYLISKGVNPTQIFSKGCADLYPVADNRTENGRALNRRVEILITHNSSNPYERGTQNYGSGTQNYGSGSQHFHYEQTQDEPQGGAVIE